VEIEFGYEDDARRKFRERELILLHNPPCNRRFQGVQPLNSVLRNPHTCLAPAAKYTSLLRTVRIVNYDDGRTLITCRVFPL
jgi:hypothetical protein